MAWALVILVLTSWPSPDVGVTFPGADKLVHFTLYLVLGVLTARALLAARASAPGPRALTRAVAALGAFGAFDELHQIPLPGRSASVADWLADSAGILVGLFLTLRLLGAHRLRTHPTP